MEHEDKSGMDERATSAPPASPPLWLRGALTAAAGALMGTLAFVLFCYALGLNFSDEGWAEDRPVNIVLLVVSLVGVAVAIFVFWLGFVQTTRTGRR